MLGELGSKEVVNVADTIVAEQAEEQEVEPQWERAECTCPDWCERDHELD